MRQRGCKDGCFWTTVPSGTCAKAVCLSLSQRQHGVGCQGKPCGCDCPSQMWKIPLKISWMFIYPAIKYYKELWRVKDRARSGCLKRVRAEAAIKTVRERICWNPLWTQKVMSRKLNIFFFFNDTATTEIYTWQCTSPQRDISVRALKEKWRTRAKHLLQWHAEIGHENILFMDEKIFSIEKQYNNQNNKIMLKRPMRWVLRVQEAITLPTSWFGGGCTIRGRHLFIFARKMWKLVPECIVRMCYKKSWNLLTQMSSMVSTQLLAARPRRLKSGCGGRFWPLSAPRIGPRRVQTSTPGL
jgi:hypothetical protein